MKFINISTHDYQHYLVVDEDVMYKWNPTNETPVKHWLKNRDMFSFKLDFEGDKTYLQVFRSGKEIVNYLISEVTYL